MTITRDAREKDPIINAGCDANELLVYDLENSYSFDFRVECEPAQPGGPIPVVKVERKAFTDYISSWTDGKLERQLAAVDLLIVEMTGYDAGNVLHVSGMAHLDILNAAVPVKVTANQAGTLAFLRRIEKRPGGLLVRENKVKTQVKDIRWRVIESLPGINPHRIISGVPVGEWLEQIIDWPAVVQGLGLEKWNDQISYAEGERRIPGTTIEKIRVALERGAA